MPKLEDDARLIAGHLLGQGGHRVPENSRALADLMEMAKAKLAQVRGQVVVRRGVSYRAASPA